jgi:hypothetical protein
MPLRALFSCFSLNSSRRPSPSRRRSSPLCLETLEDRCVPSVNHVFTVDRITDAGTSQAGMGSGTSGDLRYCIAQANASHGNAGDTDEIDFSSSVFASLKTINLSATLETLSITDPHTLTIQGPKSSVDINDNHSSFGIFTIGTGCNVTFNLVAITHGNANVFGGGIANQGTVALTDCTLENNNSLYGGGLVNIGGTATLFGCTIDHNSAQIGGGIINLSGGTLILTDTTLYGNSATNGDGGGLDNLSGTATLINCTFDLNSASNRGGGIYNNATLNMTNTILAFDTAPTGADILNSGTFGTISHNLIRIGDQDSGLVSPLLDGINGNQIGTSVSPINPKFDPLGLRKNGGPTKTIALESGSLAIDAGDDSVLTTVTTDQRGKPRKSGAHVDIGAFEVQHSSPSSLRAIFFNTP